MRDDLDSMLRRIGCQRNIRTPVIRCRTCGHIGPAAGPDVSVRVTIIALGQFGIASAEEVKGLEKHWTAHRNANGPNLHGKPAASPTSSVGPCGH